MSKHHPTSALNLTAVADPAVQLSVVALLRLIARSPAHGATMPVEALNLLGCIAGPDDLLISFAKVGQRKAVEQAMRRPDDEEEEAFDGDLDGSAGVLQMLTTSTKVSRRSVTPRSRVVAAINAAQVPAIQSLALTLLEKWEASIGAGQDWMDTNVRILKGLFGLSDVEAQVAKLAFAFSSVRGQSNALVACIQELFYCRSERRQSMFRLALALDRTAVDLSGAFSATGPLRSSGLLYHAAISCYDLDDVLRLSELGQLFASESFESVTAVRQRILSPLVLEANDALVFTHLAPQQRDISALLDGAITTGAKGINVLLYGQPGTGKTEFAKKLACDLGVNCYEVGYASDETGMEASRNDRLCFLKLANRLIAPEERAVILLDEAEDIFDSMGAQTERRRSSRSGTSKSWMNALLETMRIPTIWITNDIEIDAAHLRRFAYVTEFSTPPISVRREIVRRQTAGLAITDATITQLARNDALTPAMLGLAAQFVRLAKPLGAEADGALVRHVQASQRALSMEPAGTVVDSETAFDPRFINLDASISVENLLGALRRTGRVGLLFHGPSGSGKTQLANHLAQQLDREMLYRTGSDLLNKYVGGTEQRIAKLFRSCDVEREIIFLDEAEGLLGSRDGAQRSWEVTQVNEFLRQIEHFKGIFIAATNHVDSLDAALMRRFAFRLEFKPLTLEQRLAIFMEVSGFALKVATADHRWLAKLDGLTVGDFANVKRRLGLLESKFEANGWLDALESELAAKPHLGKNKIGFY